MNSSVVLGATAAAVCGAAVTAAILGRRKRFTWRSSHRLESGGATCVIRAAQRADADAVIAFVYKLAAADGGVSQVTVSTATIRRAFVAGEIHALLVELEGVVVAMAVVQESFRTFTGHSLYLQDLIVDQAHRGAGIGTLLLSVLAEGAAVHHRESSCDGTPMVFWESHAGNYKANRFYAGTVGAETTSGDQQHLIWKLRGSALHSMRPRRKDFVLA